MVKLDRDFERDDLPQKELISSGKVREGLVFPEMAGKPSNAPTGRVDPQTGRVYEIIYDPSSKNQPPIGSVRNGKYHLNIY